MGIYLEVISPSSKKESRADRHIPQWAIYSSAGVGVGVGVLVGFIKAFFPLIGMASLLSFILSQSKQKWRYWSFVSLVIKAFL